MALGFRRNGFSEVRSVTFQAAWRDGSFKIGGAIDVSWAVDPAIQRVPVRHGQFEELIELPIKIRLPLSSGSDDDIDLFAAHSLVAGLIQNGGLIKAVAARIHFECKLRIQSSQNVFAGFEMACDRGPAGKPGSQAVASLGEGLDLLAVTLRADLICCRVRVIGEGLMV
jgi:hypothetical protein